MQHIITINNKEYICTNIVRDDEIIRKSFDALSLKTFGLSFETWHTKGYWKDNYIPYVLIYDNKVVANVSVSIMNMNYNGLQKHYFQLGTIMTDTQYRKQNLSRYLMNIVLADLEGKSDDIFLFANDSVLDFYPKFGFNAVEEHQYCSQITKTSKRSTRKLDMANENDVEFLREMACYGNPYSKLEMTDIDSMLMFYCSQFMTENVYYSEYYNTIIIAEIEADSLICYDVFSEREFDLIEVISSVLEDTTKKIQLGFTPKKSENFELNIHKEDNTTLFMLNKKEQLLEKNNLMFPLLCHA